MQKKKISLKSDAVDHSTTHSVAAKKKKKKAAAEEKS